MLQIVKFLFGMRSTQQMHILKIKYIYTQAIKNQFSYQMWNIDS